MALTSRKDKGKLMMEKGICPFCAHNKRFVNFNPNSDNFNQKKCSRCKRWY